MSRPESDTKCDDCYEGTKIDFQVHTVCIRVVRDFAGKIFYILV